MEDETTTIQLNKSVVLALKKAKRYPRETYNEVILRLITEAKETEELGFCTESPGNKNERALE